MKFIINILVDIWNALVRLYGMYAGLIHSVFPRELGDTVVAILNIAIIFGVITLVANYAFGTKE